MGKKINQADVKKSEKALLIWASVAVAVVLIIAIAVGLSGQSSKTADTAKQSTSSQSKDAGNTSNAQTNTEVKANEPTPVQQQTSTTQTNPVVAQTTTTNVQPAQQEGVTYAEIQTTKGTIKVSLENKKMPITVGNFTNLVNKGFYNGLTFHRVEDWVIQGGDPKGDGTGGSDKTIPLETNPDLKNVRGALAMARTNDRNSATSQFYILKTDASWLDGEYAVFGNVVSGMDVVDKMEVGDKMLSIKIVK